MHIKNIFERFTLITQFIEISFQLPIEPNEPEHATTIPATTKPDAANGESNSIYQ